MTGSVRVLLIVSLFILASCAGLRIEDGGLVDTQGWPQRPANARYRCPDGTFLIDETSPSGRRTASCRDPNAQNPRGFELTWDPEGQLVSHLELTDGGAPIHRRQWFDDGAVAAEESYEEGRLVRKLAYYKNGKVRADIAYDAERDVTLVTRLGPDGSIEEKGEMRDGRLVGTWQEWRDGALETLTYIDGVAHGDVERKFPAGGVERGSYDEGKRSGKWIRVDERDNPVSEVSYVEGKRHGVWRTYHPNGQLREEGQYESDLKHGDWKSWYPSGELAAQMWFSCSVAAGPYQTYHRDGSPHIVGSYEVGKKVGEWKTFNEDGIATSIEQNAPPSTPFDPAAALPECSGEP